MINSRLRIVAGLGVIIALSGCASTHQIDEANADPLAVGELQAQKSLQGAALTTAAWPEENWWEALDDSQLNSLVAEALTRNPDMDLAAATLAEAAAQAGIVASGRRPQLQLDAGLAGARLPTSLIGEPIGGSFNWIKNIRLGLNWDIDLWGGKRAAWEAAVDRARAAEVDAEAARLSVSVGVTRAYVQLAYALRLQTIAREEVERAEQSHRLTAKRVQAGIDDQLQLKRADAEVATAEQHQAQADNQVDAARIALAVMLGQGPDRGLSIQPNAMAPVKLALPPDLPADLLGRRPDIVAARWRVESAGRDIASAKAEFLPNISLGLMAGYAAMGSDALFKSRSGFYQVAPALSLPIFHGGQLRANLRVKQATYAKAVAAYNKTLIAALNQVADVFHGLESIKKQIASQQRALAAAQSAWQIAEQRYRAGIGSYLEALSVRQQLLEAQQSAAQLEVTRLDLTLQLIEALGGGFQQEAGSTDDKDATPNTNRGSL